MGTNETAPTRKKRVIDCGVIDGKCDHEPGMGLQDRATKGDFDMTSHV